MSLTFDFRLSNVKGVMPRNMPTEFVSYVTIRLIYFLLM